MIMFMKQTKVWLVLTLALSLLALASACSKAPEANESPSTPSGTAKAPPSADLGSISGSVAFNGAVPPAKKIDTSADPACGTANPNLSTEDTKVNGGKLANAFVYIKDGAATDGTKIGDYTWSPPTTAATLDQKGCQYLPHVMGVMTNQKISITNSDPTQHNVHPTPKSNPEWNQTQPNGAPPIEKTFARAE